MSTVVAVVVTHNNRDTIGACLASLQEQGVPAIVVDAESQDGTELVVTEYSPLAYTQVVNMGFAHAANVGAKLVHDANYILFLNPDAQLQGSIQRAVSHMDDSPDVAVAGLGLRDPAGTMERSAYGEQPTVRGLVSRKVKSVSTTENPYWVSGGAMLIRASVFKELGGFDDRFFLYWEDVDLCKRVHDAGHKVVHIPEVSVIHKRGHSLADRKRKTALYDASADRYFQKHYASPIWMLHRCLRYIYRLVSPQVR